uniref:MICOS complex subunit MIC60 n=1 Tax=Panagrolaimus sp. JU765 TaxID=591449 RepID=A0AC34Q0J9_9BILA
MLRYAAKNAADKGGRQVLQTIRSESSSAGSGKKSGSLGKKLAVTVGLTGTAVGGVLGYAYVDPEFRKMVEETIPQGKVLLDNVLGPPHGKIEIPSLTSFLPKQKVELPVSSTKVLPAPIAASELPVEKPKREPVNVVPVDVKKSSIPQDVKPDQAKLDADNAALEKRLLAALSTAEAKVRSANDAKISTIAAINEHAEKLKKAVDDGVNANWETVSESLLKAEKLAKKDMADEMNSRNYIDSLRQVIQDGKRNATTANNPLLINALETANKLGYQLDELNALVQKSRNESRVLNQYKDLIDKSRQQFSLELKAILPDVDMNAKDSKLSEDELNALIAHAHLRVDQLRRQLTEQHVREEQNIARAIEEQRIADSKLAQEQLELELKRYREQQDVSLQREVLTQRANWETELEERLKRAAQAHSEHLEQVIRTQKQLYDIENAQAVEEAVAKERRLHSKQVDLALSKLSGIETALQGRAALDAENRRAKQYWLACQNLLESIVHGQKAGTDIDSRRKPLEKELTIIKEACDKDEFVQTIMGFFNQDTLQKGVYTEQDLKNRFNKIYTLAKRTAKIDDNGGGIGAYISSYIQSLFMLDLPRRFSPEDKIDVKNADTYEIIAHAKYFVNEGDFDSAVRVCQLLHGEPRRLASDWIRDTQEHLATRYLAELLVAHASVTSIRSIY